MAATYQAVMSILLQADEILDPTTGSFVTGTHAALVENETGGRRWGNGGASGGIQKCYKRTRTITSGSTDNYNLLAAGSLSTPAGVAIDADEIKGLVLKVTSGAIRLEAPAADFLGIFADANGAIKMAATGGLRCLALDFGPDGLSLGTSSKFDITEISGAASAVYELIIIVAE